MKWYDCVINRYIKYEGFAAFTKITLFRKWKLTNVIFVKFKTTKLLFT